jgi:hypothetical protein
MKQQAQPKVKHKRTGKLTAINAEETLGKFFQLELSKGSWKLKKRRQQQK